MNEYMYVLAYVYVWVYWKECLKWNIDDLICYDEVQTLKRKKNIYQTYKDV